MTMPNSPEGLPYLDTAEGIGRIGGNKALFVRLLGTFERDTNWEKLREAVAAGNLADAAGAAHAIKGMCANLSMKALAAKAAELEQVLKAGSTDDAVLAAMGEVRDETIKAVESAKAQLA